MKNAVAKLWALDVFGGRRYSTGVPPFTEPTVGLDFRDNFAAGSDSRINFTGANMPSRTSHTIAWFQWYKAGHVGYHANNWFTTLNTSSFPGTTYELGAHPHPCDGTFDGTGQRSVPGGSSGTEFYFGMSGLGAGDFIASPGGARSLEMIPERWYLHVLQTYEDSGNLISKFTPDAQEDPTFVIQQQITSASLTVPGSPCFSIGPSPWSRDPGGSSGQNEETPDSIIACPKIFTDGEMDLADVIEEMLSGLDTPVTAAGIASVFYMSTYMTPSDISDKSGENHDPAYANAHEPDLWEA